jgi:hypothetical protein
LAAAIEVGESDAIEGTGLLELTVNAAAFDVPPPGVGLTTVTLGVPLLEISEAGIWAVSCVVLTYVVLSGTPAQSTVDVDIKFVPLTVRVNAAPPVVADDGASELMTGTGFVLPEIVNVALLEVPPPGVGLLTVTPAVPAVAMLPAGIWAVILTVVTYVVASGVPFQLTTELPTKLLPLTVSVNAAPPAVALEGDNEVMAGAGLFTAKVRVPDVPPPGVGLARVILAVPVLAISVAGTCAVT